jgi:hypothetical protein
MLDVANKGYVGDLGQGVREVFEYSTEHGPVLSVLLS